MPTSAPWPGPSQADSSSEGISNLSNRTRLGCFDHNNLQKL
jgi:hypothetical protein